MSAQSTASNSSGGLLGLVFLVFLVLKLIGKIDWSWWWVTSPLWGGLALSAVIMWVIAIIACFAAERIFLGSLLTALTIVGGIWAAVAIF